MEYKTRTFVLKLEDESHFSALSDPKDKKVSYGEAFLSFLEATKLVPGNANVRPPAEKKPPFKAMLDTVENSPATFHKKSRGILYICDKFRLDRAGKTLTVTIPDLGESEHDDDAPKYGIGDGGHNKEVIDRTARTLLAAIEADATVEVPFVKVQFMARPPENAAEIEPIVEARNTSLQVRPYTLLEYQHEFAEIKDALTKAGFNPELVAFVENEDREWGIIEVIQRLACFMKARWYKTQPGSIYRASMKALDLYVNPDTRREFRALYGIIGDVLTFPEYIESQFSTGNVLKGRKLGKLRAAKLLPKPYSRPGTNYISEHRIDRAALLPIASAFRELLQLRGDKYVWRLNPREVFKHCAADLYDVLAQRSLKMRNSSQLGSDLEFWSTCRAVVMQAKDDMLEAKYKKEKKTDDDEEEDQAPPMRVIEGKASDQPKPGKKVIIRRPSAGGTMTKTA